MPNMFVVNEILWNIKFSIAEITFWKISEPDILDTDNHIENENDLKTVFKLKYSFLKIHSDTCNI